MNYTELLMWLNQENHWIDRSLRVRADIPGRGKKRTTLRSSSIQQSRKHILAVGPKAKYLWLLFARCAGGRRGEIAELKPSHSHD
jgi:hypothetical protein